MPYGEVMLSEPEVACIMLLLQFTRSIRSSFTDVRGRSLRLVMMNARGKYLEPEYKGRQSGKDGMPEACRADKHVGKGLAERAPYPRHFLA